jgi:hypothetical protein
VGGNGTLAAVLFRARRRSFSRCQRKDDDEETFDNGARMRGENKHFRP